MMLVADIIRKKLSNKETNLYKYISNATVTDSTNPVIDPECFFEAKTIASATVSIKPVTTIVSTRLLPQLSMNNSLQNAFRNSNKDDIVQTPLSFIRVPSIFFPSIVMNRLQLN
jgi:hypothetical protein